jgi:hypothetical protein
VNKWRFKGPPFPISRDLLAEFDAVTPADKKYVIADLFENITLYEFVAKDAACKALPGGKFEVTLHATAKKFRADGLGAQTEIAMNEPVDIGVLDEKDNVLWLEKRPIRSGDNQITFVVDRRPFKAGVDPLNKMINREPQDGVISVTATDSRH